MSPSPTLKDTKSATKSYQILEPDNNNTVSKTINEVICCYFKTGIITNDIYGYLSHKLEKTFKQRLNESLYLMIEYEAITVIANGIHYYSNGSRSSILEEESTGINNIIDLLRILREICKYCGYIWDNCQHAIDDSLTFCDSILNTKLYRSFRKNRNAQVWNDCNLSFFYLEYCNFSNDFFVNSKLSGASFNYCNFRNGIFEGADLKKAILTNCNFYKAKFLNTSMQGADLRGSNMEEALLYGADLTDAVIGKTQISQLFQYQNLDKIKFNSIYVNKDHYSREAFLRLYFPKFTTI